MKLVRESLEDKVSQIARFGVFGLLRSIVFIIPFIVRTYQGESTYVKFEYQYSLSLQIGSFLIFGVLSSYPTYLIKRREELHSAKRYIFFLVALTVLLSIIMRSLYVYRSSNILLMVAVVIMSSFYSVHNKAHGRPQLSQFIDVLLPVSILLLIVFKFTYYGVVIGLIPLLVKSLGTFNVRFLLRHVKVFLIAFIIQLIPQVIRILAPAMYNPSGDGQNVFGTFGFFQREFCFINFLPHTISEKF